MKVRCLQSRILAYLLAVCLLAGVFLACASGVVLAKEEYELSEQIFEVIRAVEELESATEKYYKTEDTFDYTTRYIRSGVYSDIKWQMMVGTLDPAYEKAMKPYAALREVGDLIVMTDRFGNRYCVDFPHMAAVADAKRDFAGWAGDLVTLAADISSLYEARLMMGNELGVFGALDLRADIDAFNLMAVAKENGGSLARAMRTYYLEGGVERSVTTFLLRETGLREEELNIDSIYAAFFARLDEKTCQEETLLLENMYGVTGTERLEYACLAFAEWLYRTHCDEVSGHEEIVLFMYPPTCVQDGYTCVVCRHCGLMGKKDIVPARTHHFAETRIDPTETEPGIKSEICEICGYGITTYFDTLQAGDMDLDGILSAHDYMRLKRGILGNCVLTRRQEFLADINEDDMLDGRDYHLFRTWILEGTLDGKTDVS